MEGEDEVLLFGPSLFSSANLMLPSFDFSFQHFCLFIYGCGGSRCCTPAFSNWSERGVVFLVCAGISLQWLLRCRVQDQPLWCTGLVAPRHVGSSCVPCIGRGILTHGTTRKPLLPSFYSNNIWVIATGFWERIDCLQATQGKGMNWT